jgi:hypothetical protein
LAVRALSQQTSAFEAKLHRADYLIELLRQRKRRQEETMSEFAMPAFAKSDSSGKHRDIQISTPSAEGSNSKREPDRRLDQALEDTFPASDAVSIVISLSETDSRSLHAMRQGLSSG